MGMDELEKMVRRAKSGWREGCNDRVAAEYSLKVVEAAAEMLKQCDAVLSRQAEPRKLVDAGEVLRDVLYPKVKAAPAVETSV